MTIRALLFYCLSLLTLSLLGGCGSDSPKSQQPTPEEKVDYQPMILGSWLLDRAYRNRKEAVSLENTTFEFRDDGSMTTNFNMDGEPMNYTYTVDGDMVKQTGPDQLDYYIYEVSDSTLTLQTQFRGYDFKFVLSKWYQDVVQ